jgi:hypothetical protein
VCASSSPELHTRQPSDCCINTDSMHIQS